MTDDEGNTITISLEDAATEESERNTAITDRDGNAVVLVAEGIILDVAVNRNLVYKDNAGNSHLNDAEGEVIAIAIVAIVVEPEEPQDD